MASTPQEMIQQLREKLTLQRQQVEVLQELWGELFPDPAFEIPATQFLVWLRKYDFEVIMDSFEKGADFISQTDQKIVEAEIAREKGEEVKEEPSPVTKLVLIKYVSKVMVFRKAEAKLKASRQ